MKRLFLINLLVASAIYATPLLAEEAPRVKAKKGETPWLEGVELDPVPKYITPVIPMKLYLQNGEKIPRTLTEDEPIDIQADSSIFFDEAPTRDNNLQVEIPGPAWEDVPLINWRIISHF